MSVTSLLPESERTHSAGWLRFTAAKAEAGASYRRYQDRSAGYMEFMRRRDATDPAVRRYSSRNA